MTNEKNYMGFLMHKIYVANFEAFRWNILLSTNLLFLKSEEVERGGEVSAKSNLETLFPLIHFLLLLIVFSPIWAPK